MKYSLSNFVSNDNYDENDASAATPSSESELYHPYQYEACYQQQHQAPNAVTDHDGNQNDDEYYQHQQDTDDEEEEDDDYDSGSSSSDSRSSSSSEDEENEQSMTWRERHQWFLARTNNQTTDEYDDGYNKSHQIQRYIPSDVVATSSAGHTSPRQQQHHHHYHIYYNRNDRGDHRPTIQDDSLRPFVCCRSWLFWMSSIVVLVSHVVYWYGPSVPPPQEDDDDTRISTWNDVWQTQSQLLLTLVSTWVQIARHISFWTWQGIQQDWDLWKQQQQYNRDASAKSSITKYHSFASSAADAIAHRSGTKDDPIVDDASSSLSPCPWHPEEWRSWDIFGQDLAVESLQRALSSSSSTLWNSYGKHAPTVQFFYATGGPSVGKFHLAKQMEWHMQQQQEECRTGTADYDDDDNNTDILLQLSSTKQAQDALQEDAIRRHLQAHPHGSMIVLRDIDAWQNKSEASTAVDDVLNFIVRMQQQASSNIDDSSRISGAFSNCVVYMTSSIGKATIDKALRKHYASHYQHDNSKEFPVSELESILAYQLESHYKQQQEPTSTLVRLFQESKIHVLPMVPLDRQAMQELLTYQLYIHFGIDEIDGLAMSYLLSDGNDDRNDSHDNYRHYLLEWQRWVPKTNPDTIVWNPHCPKGAQALEPILTRVQKECFANDDDDNSDVMVDDDYTWRLTKSSSQAPWLELLRCANSQQQQGESSISNGNNNHCQVQCEFSII